MYVYSLVWESVEFMFLCIIDLVSLCFLLSLFSIFVCSFCLLSQIPISVVPTPRASFHSLTNPSPCSVTYNTYQQFKSSWMIWFRFLSSDEGLPQYRASEATTVHNIVLSYTPNQGMNNQDGSVGKRTGCTWEGFRFPSGKDHSIQTGFGVHSASYAMDIGGKAAGK
jgi:hypothetical protein